MGLVLCTEQEKRLHLTLIEQYGELVSWSSGRSSGQVRGLYGWLLPDSSEVRQSYTLRSHLYNCKSDLYPQ